MVENRSSRIAGQSIIRFGTPVRNLQRRGFSFSVPNIFRFMAIAKSFFVRDDRRCRWLANVVRILLFSTLRHRGKRPSIFGSGVAFFGFSTESVPEIAFSHHSEIATTAHERIIQSWFIASHIAQSTPIAGAQMRRPMTIGKWFRTKRKIDP